MPPRKNPLRRTYPLRSFSFPFLSSFSPSVLSAAFSSIYIHIPCCLGGGYEKKRADQRDSHPHSCRSGQPPDRIFLPDFSVPHVRRGRDGNLRADESDPLPHLRAVHLRHSERNFQIRGRRIRSLLYRQPAAHSPVRHGLFRRAVRRLRRPGLSRCGFHLRLPSSGAALRSPASNRSPFLSRRLPALLHQRLLLRNQKGRPSGNLSVNRAEFPGRQRIFILAVFHGTWDHLFH